MKSSNSVVRLAVRAAITCSVTSGFVFAGSAMAAAQSQAASANAATTPAQTKLKAVQVTGTRILRTNVETAQPITTITQAQIRASGLVSVGQVLQQITQAGGTALNGTYTFLSPVAGSQKGQSTLNLRFLGSNRLLVLVNGHRWISQLNGTVDMSTIPASMIDHIEILQDGASAIYGSDAIAGVVNIITVKNFNGAEADAYMGEYDGHGFGGGWDGRNQRYDFTMGHSGAKNGLVLSVMYHNQNPIMAQDRTRSMEPIWGFGPLSGSTITPSGTFRLQGPALAGKTIGQATCGPFDLAKHQFGACRMTLIKPGQTSQPVPLNNFRNATAQDRFNYQPGNTYLNSQEQTGIYMAGHQDLASNLTFTTTIIYNNRWSHNDQGLQNFTIGPANPGSGRLGVGVGAINPYNPFGMDLVANPSQYCPDNNNAPGCSNEFVAGIQRRLVGAGVRPQQQNVDTYLFRAGLNGFFDLGSGEWDWDVGYGYGKNNGQQISFNVLNSDRIATALDAPGYSSCASTAGCVPLNIFGGSPSITPAMYKYLLRNSKTSNQSVMRDYTADITGTLAQLPAGPLSLAAGGEYLQNSGVERPDSLSEEQSVLTVPMHGLQKTDAEYVEINIPLLSDLPLAKSVSLDLANRWSQFEWSDQNPNNADFGVVHNEHATTGRWALRWQTSDDLLLRASWSQGFRAPSIYDLYQPVGGNNPNFRDPCAGPPYGGYSGSGPLPPGCGGDEHFQPISQMNQRTGGNANLRSETSISKTIGFLYSPSWIPGFDFGVDYYDIQLQHEITTISPQTIMNGCYLLEIADDCSRITVQGNAITLIDSENLNIGGINTSGADVTAHYRLPATPVGDFALSLSWSFLRSYVQTIPDSGSPTGFSSTELAGVTFTGFSGMPKQQASLSADWNFGSWSAVWNVHYIHSMYEPCLSPSFKLGLCSDPTGYFLQTNQTGRNYIGATVYNDASVTYHVDSWDSDFTFGIRNLFAKPPPSVMTAFKTTTLNSYYRIPGRFFYVRYGVKF